MKLCAVVVLLAAAAAAAPATPDGDAQILRFENDNIGVEGYNYGFDTSNGISQSEQGQLKNVGSDNEVLEVRGQFSYPGQDGVVYSVSYVANEEGFKPVGAHLPQAQ